MRKRTELVVSRHNFHIHQVTNVAVNGFTMKTGRLLNTFYDKHLPVCDVEAVAILKDKNIVTLVT